MIIDKQISFFKKWLFPVMIYSIALVISNSIYIFLFLNAYFAESYNEIATLLLTALLLVPFIFAPSFIAVSSCSRLLFKDREEGFINRFLRSYREHYKLAVIQGFIYMTTAIVLILSFFYYGRFAKVGYIIPAILFIILNLIFLFVLAYSSDRVERVIDYWKVSALIVLNHPLHFILMGSLLSFILIISQNNGAVALFIAPGTATLVVMYTYQKLTGSKKYEQKSNSSTLSQ